MMGSKLLRNGGDGPHNGNHNHSTHWVTVKNDGDPALITGPISSTQNIRLSWSQQNCISSTAASIHGSTISAPFPPTFPGEIPHGTETGGTEINADAVDGPADLERHHIRSRATPRTLRGVGSRADLPVSWSFNGQGFHRLALGLVLSAR